MKASLTAATSLIALMVFGAGQPAAAPILANKARLSASSGDPGAEPSLDPAIGADKPIADRVATPGAAYSYAPNAAGSAPGPGLATEAATVDVPARAKSPPPILSRRNPGNQSNLLGTIGAMTGGLLARIDPRAEILTAESSADDDDASEPGTAFGATGTDETTLSRLAASANEDNFVGRVTPREQLGASVFVGQVDRAMPGRGVRRMPVNALVATATGAATATMVIVAEPDGDAASVEAIDLPGAFEWRGHLLGAARSSLASRRHAAIGAVGTSTLGYTYSPISRARLPVEQPISTVSASAARGPEAATRLTPPIPAPAAISTAHAAAAPTVYQAMLAQRLDEEGRSPAKRESSPERFTLSSPAETQLVILSVPLHSVQSDRNPRCRLGGPVQ